MKKKSVALLVSLTMLCTLVTTGGSNKKVLSASTPNTKQFMQSLPSYEKLDKDVLNEAAASGEKLIGKDLHGYNGNAYLKPGTTGTLDSLDARGKDKKGIAILVDFPVPEGKISEVPGVNYNQIPKT